MIVDPELGPGEVEVVAPAVPAHQTHIGREPGLAAGEGPDGVQPEPVEPRGDGSLDIEDMALTGVAPADLMALAFAYRADGSDASATAQAQVA